MGKLSAQAEKVYNLLKIRTCEQDNSGTYCIYPRKEIAKGALREFMPSGERDIIIPSA